MSLMSHNKIPLHSSQSRVSRLLLTIYGICESDSEAAACLTTITFSDSAVIRLP